LTALRNVVMSTVPALVPAIVNGACARPKANATTAKARRIITTLSVTYLEAAMKVKTSYPSSPLWAGLTLKRLFCSVPPLTALMAPDEAL